MYDNMQTMVATGFPATDFQAPQTSEASENREQGAKNTGRSKGTNSQQQQAKE